VRVKINVAGIVQGVGFRPFVYRIAVQNGLAGYVRNRGDAGVKFSAGNVSNRSFHARFSREKPPLAQIHDAITTRIGGKNEYTNFTIYKSSEEAELAGSVVPPDVAICNECLDELRD
jgi:hydrogenase maturation protein HypF